MIDLTATGLESEFLSMLNPDRITLTPHALERLKQRLSGRDALNGLRNILDCGSLSCLGKDRLEIRHGNYVIVCRMIRNELIIITFIDRSVRR